MVLDLAYQLLNILPQNHGGDVSLWSVEGAGSTFTIRFPLSSNALAAEKPNMEGNK